VQIIENWSRIQGRVEAWEPPSREGEPGTLTLTVEQVDGVTSSDGSRYRNLMRDAAGRRVAVIVPARAAASIHPREGSTAVLDVRLGNAPDRMFAHPDHITVTNE
jgi:hypothetical protein